MNERKKETFWKVCIEKRKIEKTRTHSKKIIEKIE